MDVLPRPTLRCDVKALTVGELLGCAKDAIAWQDDGVLQDGPLRALAARLEAETGIDEMSSLQQVEAAILREIAVRFVDVVEQSHNTPARKALHPEQLPGEIHLCDLEPSGAKVVGWKSKRIGERAFRPDGTKDSSKVPVFVMADEFREAGQWDSRYTIKE